ncbi:glycoside hydrolase family 43 protein [Xanthomonas arboricola pv. juglandis]|uniref:hypothetical protein n=1 Tax=Xanthomonas TaxID=338 RepID=UPI000E5C5218|nr:MULTISPECIES: hypothetical protein [Xanthomonas]SYZ57432.1 glycoside hydrolase family 43 protein [Xanthomonas arboricola pv. juglandis]MBB3780286.1 hypothetical protein [Xanthomonas euroxanthea]NJC39464.1 hypothetical protein [Xanthomonas euroxanthea]CAD1797467.1 hypothetical protein XSP_003999 [Xanthomonas sp. CPBF 426]CAG2097522.1 hypothetical protein XCY_003957 [Xanthomonas euroxanthea]
MLTRDALLVAVIAIPAPATAQAQAAVAFDWLHSRNDDAGMLSTAQAGGFVGSMIGPFAQLEPHRTQED